MNELLRNLLDSVQAVPVLFKEYRNLIGEQRIDTGNKTVKQRVIQIYCGEARSVQTDLTRKLGLLDLAVFPPYNIRENVHTACFVQSVTSYTAEWEQALANHSTDKKVQDLITEILSLPLEMTRLTESVKGDYSHVASKIRAEDINGKLFIKVAVEYLRSEIRKRSDNQL